MLQRISTKRELLATNKNVACTKAAERRTKGVCGIGEARRLRQSRIFQQPAISQTGPLACEQKAT